MGRPPSDADFEWNIERDIEALDEANDEATGLWSDGETLWVAQNSDGGGDGVYAYDLASGERREDREVELDGANLAPRGIWSDREVIWVSDSGKDKLFAHDLESGERLEDRDLALDRQNGAARGIWSDGETLWVLDGRDDAVYRYDLGSGELLDSHDLVSSNNDPHDIWSDGVTIWVSDGIARKLLAYRLEEGALEREGAEDFRRLTRARNNSPRGIWSDGDVMYVVDRADEHVYSYNMPDATDARLASLTLSGVDIGEFSSARTDYSGVATAGTVETTVEAEAVQSGASVVIEPDDADGDAENGRQVALEQGAELTVTVSSADGSRERVYRVDIEVPQCLDGLGDEFGIVTFAGGSIAELEECARSLSVTALYAADGAADGERYVSYILGAPTLVNQAFSALFPDGLPAGTELLARSEPPPAEPDTGAEGS